MNYFEKINGSLVFREDGETVEASAPIATIPVFLRDGKQEYLIGEFSQDKE